MTEKPTLLIRADGSKAIGAGHIMRQIAVGRAWMDIGGRCCVASNRIADSLVTRLAAAGFELWPVESASAPEAEQRALEAAVRQQRAVAVVLDGYHFDQDYCEFASALGCATALFDDIGQLEFYPTDFVVNQNVNADPALYRNRGEHTRLLLGPAYSLIRDELRFSPGRYRRRGGAIGNVLITLGGADPCHATETVIRGLLRSDDMSLNFRVIIGGLYGRTNQVRELIAADRRFELLVDVSDMSSHYTWADLAIAAGGSSNWEMCCFSLPRIVLVIADNQRGIASSLADRGIAINLGPVSSATEEAVVSATRSLLGRPDRVRAMASAAGSLLDGLGAIRFATELMSCARRQATFCRNVEPVQQSQIGDLVFRAAAMQDWQMLLRWRNDPQTRSASRGSEEIDESSHRSWLAQAIDDPARILLIAEHLGVPVGTVRVDPGEVRELSWTVAPEERGKGLGQRMVKRVAEFLSGPLRAVAHRANTASHRVARAAGFELENEQDDWFTFTRYPKGEVHDNR